MKCETSRNVAGIERCIYLLRAKLRRHVTAAAREEVEYAELLRGVKAPVSRLAASVRKTSRKAATAASRAWASCLKKIFEINPLLCRKCGIEMVPVAAIVADAHLVRLLSHLGLSTEFPKTRPARAPPFPLGQESQIDPAVDAVEGIDEDRGWQAA